MPRAVIGLVAALCATGLSPLADRQAVDSAPAAMASRAPASSPSTARPGITSAAGVAALRAPCHR